MEADSPLLCISTFLCPRECLQGPFQDVSCGDSCLMLKEKKNEGLKRKLEKFRLINVPAGVIVYAIDDALEIQCGKTDSHLKVFSNLIEQVKGVHSPCDYLIFFLKHNKIHVILCEMKTHREGCENKIKATRCFVEYVKSLISNFEEISSPFFAQNFIYSNVLVSLSRNTSCGSLSKNGTHPSFQTKQGNSISGENEIHYCPLNRMNNGAFEMEWATFLQYAQTYIYPK